MFLKLIWPSLIHFLDPPSRLHFYGLPSSHKGFKAKLKSFFFNSRIRPPGNEKLLHLRNTVFYVDSESELRSASEAVVLSKKSEKPVNMSKKVNKICVFWDSWRSPSCNFFYKLLFTICDPFPLVQKFFCTIAQLTGSYQFLFYSTMLAFSCHPNIIKLYHSGSFVCCILFWLLDILSHFKNYHNKIYFRTSRII